jgi:hypothetical protein
MGVYGASIGGVGPQRGHKDRTDRCSPDIEARIPGNKKIGRDDRPHSRIPKQKTRSRTM